MPSQPPQSPDRRTAAGLAFAIASYVLWGFLPLYFIALRPAGAVEIVAWRIVLSVVFCVLVITVMRGWPRLAVILRDRRTVLLLALAGALILVNWLIYVFATVSGHVVEASLGYFINPIITALMGVLVLREKLRPLQWAAIGISAVAVLVLAVNYGAVPWVALGIAFSFGLYGLAKKKVGGSVDAVSGLTIETAALSPFAVIALVVIANTTGLSLGAHGTAHTVLFLLAGVITAVPLLLFASGARRLPLTYMGLTQYFAPVLQLIIGVAVLGEDMPPARWIGFGIVWLALALLTVDMLRHGAKQRAAASRTPIS